MWPDLRGAQRVEHHAPQCGRTRGREQGVRRPVGQPVAIGAAVAHGLDIVALRREGLLNAGCIVPAAAATHAVAFIGPAAATAASAAAATAAADTAPTTAAATYAAAIAAAAAAATAAAADH